MTDRSPGFDPAYVGSHPESSLRCLVYRDGNLVKVRVNEAYGAAAWDHAAHHAASAETGLGFACVVGVPCGYDGDPSFMARLATE